MAFAGLWEQFEWPDGTVLRTFTIITANANAMMAELHDRMPVILDPGLESDWLDPGASEDDLLAMLRPLQADLLRTREISDSVNDVRNDGPELLEPRPEALKLL